MKASSNNKTGKALSSGVISGLTLLFFAVSALAAPSGIEQIANYKGKDREQFLADNASKEAMLSIYTGINVKDARLVVDNFKKKYPFIKVDLYSATSEDVANRLMTEQKGGRFTADTFDSPSLDVEKVRREGLLLPYYTPAQDIFQRKYLDPHKFWMPMYHNMLTFVYNTNEIKEPPKGWQELIEPKWKGKLTIEDADVVWLITFFKFWGEAKAKDYFTRLGRQDLKIVHGHSVMEQMLIIGDVVSTPTQYLHQAITDKKKGAPVNYVLMDPMASPPNVIGLVKNAAHPYAAMLYIDYVSSKEGQMLFYNQGRNVSYPGIDPFLKDANVLIDDPTISMNNYGNWQKLYADLLIAPNKQRR